MDEIEKSVDNDIEKKEIDWQDNCPDINSRMKKILETKLGADCEFLVGNEQNQKSFSGHKIILAMASPVFEKTFYGSLPAKDKIIVSDIDPDIFQVMIDFIYTDEIQIQDIDDSINLFYVARKYLIKPLAKRCTDYMLQNMKSTNVFKIYDKAYLFEDTDLMTFCFQFISGYAKPILIDKNFLKIEPFMVSVIFSLKRLNIESEVDLWEALNSYAIANGYITPLNENDDLELGSLCKDDNDSENNIVRNDNKSITNNEENLLKCEQDQNSQQNAARQTKFENISSKNITDLRQAVENIRFLTLTWEEFSHMRIYPEILSDSEAFSLLMNICNPNCLQLIPKGFSGSRTKRSASLFAQGTKFKACGCGRTASGICNFCGQSCQKYEKIKLFNYKFYENSSITPSTRIKHIKMMKKQTLDFEMSFIVDKDIYLKGVTIPAQTLDNSLNKGFEYTECLGVYLLDDRDCYSGYTNCAKNISYNSFNSIDFPKKVFIEKHRIYKIGISFYVPGYYPLYPCHTQLSSHKVLFWFFIKSSDNPFSAGLINKICFQVP